MPLQFWACMFASKFKTFSSFSHDLEVLSHYIFVCLVIEISCRHSLNIMDKHFRGGNHLYITMPMPMPISISISRIHMLPTWSSDRASSWCSHYILKDKYITSEFFFPLIYSVCFSH